MFQLDDLRKTRVWQEAVEEGREQGLEEGREQGEKRERAKNVRRCLENGISAKETAELLGLSVQEVRRLSKSRDL